LVQRPKFETVKAILTSEYWLLFSLTGVFLCFFASGSGANLFLSLTGIFLIIELLLGNYRIKQIPSWYLAVAAICAYLVLASVLNPYAYSKLRYIKRLVRMVIIIFAIHCLCQKEIEDRITLVFSGMLTLAICWQFTAVSFFGKPYGTYTNPHYLAGFAVLALPLIVYFFLVTPNWYRYIFLPLIVLDVHLLLQTGSRPAFWSIACVALFVFIFLGKGWYRWLGIMLICSIITVLYVTDYPVATTYTTHPITLKTLIQNLKAEERIQFWQDAWKMQKDSSLIGWILGNGIGSFRVLFPKYSVPQYSHFIFPHNFFLEVLYENGIVGFVLIFGGLGFLFSTAMIKAKKVVNKQRSILLRCMIILFLMWFIYCGLVFPFYSNYTLIPLAFILGTLLVMVGRMPRDEVLQHNNRG
jgi:O-antigen ligase